MAYLVVSDIEATRDALIAAGVEVSEIFHLGPDGPVNGLDPERRSYFSRATPEEGGCATTGRPLPVMPLRYQFGA